MVCHAPAILRNVRLTNGKFLVEGKNLTRFKDSHLLIECTISKNGTTEISKTSTERVLFPLVRCN